MLLTVVADCWLLPALAAAAPEVALPPRETLFEPDEAPELELAELLPLFTGAVTAVEFDPDTAPEFEAELLVSSA